MIPHLVWALLLMMAWCGAAFADADGPDFWSVYGVEASDVLNIREKPDWRSARVGSIPFEGRCIKNLGCVGGLTLEEYRSLSKEAKARILKKRPRWCQIEYEGQTGWVAGRYLREDEAPCPPSGAPTSEKTRKSAEESRKTK